MPSIFYLYSAPYYSEIYRSGDRKIHGILVFFENHNLLSDLFILDEVYIRLFQSPSAKPRCEILNS